MTEHAETIAFRPRQRRTQARVKRRRRQLAARPGKHHRNEVARLNALAVLLVGNGLDAAATETARKHITDTLQREADRLGPKLASTVADLEQLDFYTRTVHLGTGNVEKEVGAIAVNARNIDDVFKRARRALGDAAAKWYWDALCDGGMDADDAKLHAAALASDPTVPSALESSASTLVDGWRLLHNGAISTLPDAKRALFYNIWQQARDPQQVTMIMPTQVTAPDRESRHPKHIYADITGHYPATLTGWEDDVLKAELARGDDLVGWYRNPTGGLAALAVPYSQGSKARTLYPDFLFFYRENDSVVADIVDPHQPNAGDAGPKWTGLATYASKHGPLFRRVVAVIKARDGTLLSLDLTNPSVAAALSKATSETEIRGVFTKFGGNY